MRRESASRRARFARLSRQVREGRVKAKLDRAGVGAGLGVLEAEQDDLASPAVHARPPARTSAALRGECGVRSEATRRLRSADSEDNAE